MLCKHRNKVRKNILTVVCRLPACKIRKCLGLIVTREKNQGYSRMVCLASCIGKSICNQDEPDN